ncbi:retention module-containing protein [Pseudomonas sp. LG1D9]|nr:retention module-containing protein [Pseudomonas sp. LG1D9]
MAKLIGVVSKVVGEVFAVAGDGSRRSLIEGDRLFAGEQLQTGAAGAVAVQLTNGHELTLGRDSSLGLSPQLLAGQAPQVHGSEDLAPSQAQLTDVQQLQKAIAAGADPTQTGEATAAGQTGSTAAGELGGGHSFVLLTEVAGRVEPVIGFPTAGFGGIPEFPLFQVAGQPDTGNDQPVVVPPDNPVSLGGLEVEGGELTLDEANLAQGSASNPAALVQSGTFNVSAPDGLQSLTVGGISVVSGGVASSFPQTITTGLGNTLSITGYNAATGVISYSYTLTGNEAHPSGGGTNSLGEQFAVVATDSDNDTATGSLDITVIDDVPKALDDSHEGSASESLLTLSGNVLDNDTQGADRIATGPIVGGTFTGQYGTLVLAADGSYTYTLNTADPDFVTLQGGGNGTETFTYTLTDADGDSSTANLVLQVHNNDDPVVIGGISINGADLTLYEKNLVDGSSPDAGALTRTGSLTVSAADGLQNLSVGGISVVSGGVAAGFPQSIATGLGNTLTITGFDPATGVITYSYTLTGTEAHPTAAGVNELTESFSVIASDTNNSTATSTLHISVVDDVPAAADDSNAQVASESLLTLTGSVLGNDVQGADRVATGPVTAGTFTGTYGTLQLFADGSYVYTLDKTDPQFMALNGGGSGTETFTYQLNDSDGDTSTANLVLQVHNNDDPVVLTGLEVNGGEVTAYEKNLPLGSAIDGAALTQSGTFTVTALDGLKNLTVGGISVVSNGVAATFPQSEPTGFGNTLTITGYNASTGVISYSYTLNGTDSHPTGADANSISESFAVVATDSNNSGANGSLDVTVVDDVPKAFDDNPGGVASESQLILNGSVLGNDVQGADRIATGPVTAGTFTGTYGTLQLFADGSYTYTLDKTDPQFVALNGGGSGTETFTYQLNDSDGDTSTAKLVLQVHNNDDPVVLTGLEVNGGEVTVYEKNLPLGSANDGSALTQSGTFTVTALDGLKNLTVGGISVVTNGVAATFPQSEPTGFGNTLTITGYNTSTGVISYSYTLNGTDSHPTGAGTNSISESFTVTATDSNNSGATGTLDVNVVDDVPKAFDDNPGGVASESLLTLTGSVLGNDVQGADRIATGPVTPNTIVGTYGTLQLFADGSYVYTLDKTDPQFMALNGGGSGTETFTYQLNDSDGDTSTANLVLQVHNNDDPVVLTGLEVNGGEVTVYEKNLPLGSAIDGPALTQSGTFTVTALDGLKNLTVGGISVVTNGVAATFPQSEPTGFGNTLTITGYNASTGVISYSYTLNGTDSHPTGADANSISESFAVVATDSNNSGATGTLDVNVVDDVPKAFDDNPGGVASESQLILSGSVLGNDVQGADRVATGPVTAGTFTGTYGTLQLFADGSYTYTLDKTDPQFVALNGGGSGTETFTYQLNDSDGDTSTAKLVLQVHNNDDPVVLTGLEVNGGEVTVYEKNLPLGSANDGPALTQSGTFTVTALDGLKNLTVGGISVVTNGVAATFPQSEPTGFGNTLTITGYNASTGVISYSYTLNGTDSHPTGAGTNSISESFAVTATDSNNSGATGTLDVNVVDDVPKAFDDNPGGVASESQLTLTGSVLGNDVQGADRVATGPVTPNTIVGTYGTLQLFADGSYTYTLDKTDPQFVALNGGGSGTETFTYQLNDSDGDTSTANLVLQVHNNDDPVVLTGLEVNGGEVTVYEKNLPLGSAIDGSALTQSGTFTVTALDGLKNLTVGGISVVSNGVAATFPQSEPTGFGNTLTITGYNASTGVISYSYTLNGTDSHPTGAGTNSISESFAVTATDSNNSGATSTLDVNVVDDVPKAFDDNPGGVASENQLTLTGSVLGNDVQGADRVATGPVTPNTIVGTYGTLQLFADGSYVYTLDKTDPQFMALNGGGSGTETFTYQLNDSDGDTSTANLVLQVHNNDDPVVLTGLEVNGGEVTVYEKNLPLGSANDGAALTQSGTFTVTALDGLKNLTVGGISVVTNGVAATFPQSEPTGFGNTLTITGYNTSTGVISYSYTLNGTDSHPTGAGTNSISESFTVTATDSNNSGATGTLDVNVVDDVPKAFDDNPGGVASESQLTLTGSVLGNDVQGADRIATGPVTAGTFNGTYGTLQLFADGSYTYTLDKTDPQFVALNGGGSGTETFTYQLNDSDGDTSTAKLVLQVHNNDDPVVLTGLEVNGGEVTVYEKNLPLGSANDGSALTQSGTFTVTALDGLKNLTVGGISVVTNGVTATFPQSEPTGFGNTLTITGYNASTGVISYSYTLNGTDSHPTGAGTNSISESFTVTATDSNNSGATGTLDVNVVDDVPKAFDDNPGGVASESQLTLTGSVLGNDVQGADRIATGPVTPNTIVGTYGTLQLFADGSYTYTLDKTDPQFIALHGGGNGTETFTYQLNDSDGDTSTAKLVLQVHNNNDPVVLTGLDLTGGELTVFEKNLVDGSNPNTPLLTQTGTFTVTALDGLKNLTVGGLNVVTNGVVATFPLSEGTLLGNSFVVTGYDPNTGVVSYRYTLLDNETHPNASGANSLSEQIPVTASDYDTNTATGTIDINIIDDLPIANPDVRSVAEGGVVSVNVLGNDVGGADSPTLAGAVVGVRAGSNVGTPASGGLGGNITGSFGYLTLDANGNAVYHSNPNSVNPPGAVDTFVYTVRDADGDLSTTTLTINVADSGLVASVDSDVTVYEKALDLKLDGLDLAPGTVIGSDPTATSETATGTLVGSTTGGTGPLSFSLVGSATGSYGQILLNANGTYTYTLTSAPKTLPNSNDGPNVLTETFTYKVTDQLGNSTTSSIVVSIVDDMPIVVSSAREVTATEVDSNLLLIIDISGSMNDASGAGGTRLDLAKASITQLLNRYDDMGDVKVQIVTFNDSSQQLSSQWVSVATAKTLVNGLTAFNGTNYDSALGTAQTAYGTAGKLEGAQNVAYFFSDGNPTTSNTNNPNNPGNVVNPEYGDGIDATEEGVWRAFLDANGIKAYAIGLGAGVNSIYLDPVAYDGSTHTNTNAVVVANLAGLDAVLAGTVQGAPVTGSLLTDGTFGADGGFVKSLTVDGITYTYNPAAGGSMSANLPGGHGTFDTVSNSITITTNQGGTLIVDMDNGEFRYNPPKLTGSLVTETFGVTVSDNDGDLATSSLVVKVNPNVAPVAGDDHVITNILSGNIVVPAQLLLANDSDANHDNLTPIPTSFPTGWVAKGAAFTGTGDRTVTGTSLGDVRTSFADIGALTAALAITGNLSSVGGTTPDDRVTVTLKAGETLNLDHNRPVGNIVMTYSLNGGGELPLTNGATLTALTDGSYQIHIANTTNPTGGNANGAESYRLDMKINYAGAQDYTPDYHGNYSVSDNHGGSDSAAVDITYQAGTTLTGTNGDDILMAGPGNNILNGGDGNDVLSAGNGNNEMHGGNGNDLLFSGIGNDLLDGGAGIDTVSYANATSGVTVNLGTVGGQITGGAGTDTLQALENLIGSNFNDFLTGNGSNNLISGGLGNDTLKGEGGDDILIGGPGNNTLTGGAGADTFQYLTGGSGHDVITDFTVGTDKLDLSQLLQGENATTASLDDYLHFKVVSGTTTIDISSVAGATATQTIDLAGVNLATQYGVTPGAGGLIAGGADTATIINGMLNDHSLKVDTV